MEKKQHSKLRTFRRGLENFGLGLDLSFRRGLRHGLCPCRPADKPCRHLGQLVRCAWVPWAAVGPDESSDHCPQASPIAPRIIHVCICIYIYVCVCLHIYIYTYTQLSSISIYSIHDIRLVHNCQDAVGPRGALPFTSCKSSAPALSFALLRIFHPG